MRASRRLRHRALANRTRYAVRALASHVLPSLVESMQVMNATLAIQGRILHRAIHGSQGTDSAQQDRSRR